MHKRLFLVKKISRGLVFVIFSNGFVFTPLPSAFDWSETPLLLQKTLPSFTVYIYYILWRSFCQVHLYIFLPWV